MLVTDAFSHQDQVHGEGAAPSALSMRTDMKHALMAGTRLAGSADYTFIVYGGADNCLPPARLSGPLRELARWLGDAAGQTAASANAATTPFGRPHLKAL